MKFWLVLVFLGVLHPCWTERILFMLPVPSRSHYILNEYLMETLAEKGHDVTVIAPFKKSKFPGKVKEIIVPNGRDKLFGAFLNKNSSEGMFQMRNGNPLMLFFLNSLGSVMMELVMNHQPVKDLLNSDQKFDLIVGESFLMEGLLAGFAQKYKAPIVMICPSIPFSYVNEMAGNPAPASYIPEVMLGYTDSMSFHQRALNFLYGTFSKFIFYNIQIPSQDALMREYFGANNVPLMEILLDNPVVLVNHHFSLAFPRPYVPNMVEIGGYHVRPPKPLPKDLQTFIEEAKDGVIFFSMGSNLKSEEFPKEKFDGILRAFSRLKERVLWKFENENPPNLPKNVKISKWLPQSDILAHPNVKLFVTHGGLLSITESVIRGVPVIVIPIFGDQPTNARFIEKIEVGIKLEYDEINEESMYRSIHRILDDPKYAKNMKLRSKLIRDRPLSPVATAVYWLEYVMRHNGAKHLRSGVHDLLWVQRELIDVRVVVLLTILVVFQILKILTKRLKRILSKDKNKNVSEETKKKKKKN